MNYTLIIQHTTTKKISHFNLQNIEDSTIYFHFKLIIPDDVDDGEYRCFLLKNEDELSVYFNQNDVKKSEIDTDKYIFINNNNSILKTGDLILCVAGDEMYNTPINVISSGLIVVGEYKRANTQYNKDVEYKQYGE